MVAGEGRLLPFLVLLSLTWSPSRTHRLTNCFFLRDRGDLTSYVVEGVLHQRKPNGTIDTIQACQIKDDYPCLAAFDKFELDGFSYFYHDVYLKAQNWHPRESPRNDSWSIIHWSCRSGTCNITTGKCAPGTRPSLVLKAYENPALMGMIDDTVGQGQEETNYTATHKPEEGPLPIWIKAGLSVFKLIGLSNYS